MVGDTRQGWAVLAAMTVIFVALLAVCAVAEQNGHVFAKQGVDHTASALQSGVPSVIPIVTIGDVDIGTAPGGARPANVGNGDGIVGLFNSAASRAGGLLSTTTDAPR